mgnify:CR=1 FL=1
MTNKPYEFKVGVIGLGYVGTPPSMLILKEIRYVGL